MEEEAALGGALLATKRWRFKSDFPDDAVSPDAAGGAGDAGSVDESAESRTAGSLTPASARVRFEEAFGSASLAAFLASPSVVRGAP